MKGAQTGGFHCSFLYSVVVLHLRLHLLNVFGGIHRIQLAELLGLLGSFGGVGGGGQGRQGGSGYVIVAFRGRRTARRQRERKQGSGQQAGKKRFFHG